MNKLKYFSAALVLFMVSFVGGCAGMDMHTKAVEAAKADEQDLHSRFVLIEVENPTLFEKYTYTIMKDKKTGVQYLLVEDGHRTGITILLDADGKPLVSEGE